MTQTPTATRQRAATRPPPTARLQPAVRLTLTGRGALFTLFGISFLSLLIAAWTGWNTLADAVFMGSCAQVAWHTKPSGLRLLVMWPPLAFLLGSTLAQLLAASGTFAALEQIFVTLAVSAPWLFTGTALTFAIAYGRGYRPQFRDRALAANLRGAARDAWSSRRLALAAGAGPRGG
jgi:hypothetical protein